MNFTYSHIDHIVLRARDPKKLIEFYTEVMGFRIDKQTSKFLGLTHLRGGNFFIDIVAYWFYLGLKGGPKPDAGENMEHFCLALENFNPKDAMAYFEAKALIQRLTLRIFTGLNKKSGIFLRYEECRAISNSHGPCI